MLGRLLRMMLVLLALAAAQAASATSIPPGVTAYLDQLRKSDFSGVILVAHHGQVVVRAYGMADREFRIPNRIDTKFRIGSLTKQFTAAAMLLLVKDGRLSLEDPVCRFLDSCPQSWRPIRVEQLLNHSSGIPDFVRLPGMRDRFTQPITLPGMIKLLEGQPLDFAPGSDARYGNSGFLISAYIIEKLSGRSYAQFLDARIYRPLGMTASGYAYDAPIIPNRARGYIRKDGQWQNAPFIDMSVPIGAGSQYSTVGDLYRWDRALRTDRLLPASLRERMFQRSQGDFGLGWEVADEQSRRVIEHNGDINGFGAFIARWPDQDAAIIILTNAEGTKVRDMKDFLAARLFADRLP